MRLLLIEDEKRLSDALIYILQKNSYTVDCAEDGDMGEYMALNGEYDLIILDRMLPYKSGADILTVLRSKGIKAPVIFLTALDSVENRIEGLDLGADDYLVKPFATEELLARVRALLRRKDRDFIDKTLSLSNVTLDLSRNEINCENTNVKLTVKEAQLLNLFMNNPNNVLSKERILEKVWGYDTDVELNNIETYVHFLRKKLESTNSNLFIQTVRGVGYCLKEEA